MILKYLFNILYLLFISQQNEIFYVARYKKTEELEHHNIDYAIGFLDKKDSLGNIHVTVASQERSFQSGEILIATEPIRYELFDVKFIKSKLNPKNNRTLLGQTVLKNEGEAEMDVNAVIGYEYDVVRNFGTHESIAWSVNATAHINQNEPVNFLWGSETSFHVVNSKSVGTRLQKGTALNVTLWGTYVTNESPYLAKLLTYWADGTKSKKRIVEITVSI